MTKKKSDPQDKATEQQVLEQRVDAIMNGKASDATTSSPETAPQLPAQLLKTISTKTTKAKAPKPEPPSDVAIVIDDTAEAENIAEAKTEPVQEPEPAQKPEPAMTDNDPDPLEDNATDKAVEDIVATEADMQLAVDDAVSRQKAAAAQGNGPGILYSFFTNPWTWLFIIGIVGVTYAWFH
jgi:hypothetical protein